MTLTNIRYFIEVAQCENITKAAEKLFVSQPSLSKQIALMEKEIGVPLFSRAHRVIQLTPAGRYLYHQFKQVLEQADHAINQSRMIGRESPNDISIGLLEGQEFTNGIMRRLRSFFEKHQGIDIRLERSTFSKLRHGLENAYYDLIITLSFDIEHLKEIQTHTILVQRGAIAINMNHPKANIEDLTLAMLSNEDFVSISAEESPNGYAMLVKSCCMHGFSPKIVRQHKTLENLLLSVEAGDGIAILDRNTRLGTSSAVRIVPIPDSDPSPVCAAWVQSNPNPVIIELAHDLTISKDEMEEGAFYPI